jgi:hypothetical protein
MSIVNCPDDSQDYGRQCVICGNKQPLHALTAGYLTADGLQAFACNYHFFDGKLYAGWAAFTADQRALSDRSNALNEVYNAQLIC